MINSQKEISAALRDSSGHSYLQQLKETYASSAEHVVTKCRLLLRNIDGHESSARNSDLIALFERAGNLACQLHDQCVETKALFPHHEMGGFSVDSRIMEAHTTIDIEQNAHEWDDNPVDLVIQPAIIAHGNERGENYTEFKVSSKAVVWMTRERQSNTPANGSAPTQARSVGKSSVKDKASASASRIASRIAIVIIERRYRTHHKAAKEGQRQGHHDNGEETATVWKAHQRASLFIE
jgi:hypothetical protein